MRAFYEVWDYETGNVINSVDTIDAALSFVRTLFDLNGSEGIRELAVMRQSPDSSGEYEPKLIAEGMDLLAFMANGDARADQRAAS